jgi:hypothetical protein
MISKTKVSSKYFDGMHCRLCYQGGIIGGKKMHLVQKLVVKAIALAIARDGASGGVVRTINVSYFSFYVDVYVCK